MGENERQEMAGEDVSSTPSGNQENVQAREHHEGLPPAAA